MIEVQSDIRVMNERIESRHQDQKAANARIDARIDMTNKDIKDKSETIEKQVAHGDIAYNIINGIGITIGSILPASAVGAWLYVIALQGVK